MFDQAAAASGDQAPSREALHRFIGQQFRDLIGNPMFPCTIARGTVSQDRVSVGVYDDLADPDAAGALLGDLRAFIAAHPAADQGFDSFAAVFVAPASTDELAFERLLWRLLQHLHALDAPDSAWDPAVGSDPAEDHFSFSLGGRAFFIVGMHPGASRHARRFAYPVVVFNAHAQFETLRGKGAYDGVRDRIRANDTALQGSINPALRDHGDGSEARQYSGRDVAANWECPFRPETGK